MGLLGVHPAHSALGDPARAGSGLQVWLASPTATAAIPREAVPAGEPVAAATQVPDPPVEGAASDTGDALVPLPVYLPTAMLSRSPRPLAEPEIDDSPGEAGAPSGKVLLELLVSRTGTVDDASVIESDLPEADALRARGTFARLPFAPGELHGAPVAARMRIEVSFEAAR
ncbi:MAG: hypothetical protein OHK0026_08040 [Rhodocyclaceae bacterium]